MTPERLRGESRRVPELSCNRLCVRGQRSGLEGSSPFRLGRYHAQFLGRTESEAAVELRRAEQNDQGNVRGISSGEERVHQRAADARALVIRKDADRPHGNNWVGGDGRLARRNVADDLTLGKCGERKLGNRVASLPQRLEQGYPGGDCTRSLRRPKTRPPKSFGVNLPNRLVVVALLLPDDHRLIVASPISRLRDRRYA
jgi:hypothetical protein